MNFFLTLAQHFHAAARLETISINRFIEFAPIIDDSSAIKLIETSVKLANEPVIYRTPDGQLDVLNARQVIFSANGNKFHPNSKILVTRITDEQDLPMARLHFEIVEPAQLFGEIDNLIHAAYLNNHQTALMKRFLFQQGPDRQITTSQLENLCRSQVRKSTLNNRKAALGYTLPGRGCKARQIGCIGPHDLEHRNK